MSQDTVVGEGVDEETQFEIAVERSLKSLEVERRQKTSYSVNTYTYILFHISDSDSDWVTFLPLLRSGQLGTPRLCHPPPPGFVASCC